MMTTNVPPPNNSMNSANNNKAAINTNIIVGIIDKPNPTFAIVWYLPIPSKTFIFLLCLINFLAVMAKAIPKAGIREKQRLIIANLLVLLI